MSIFEYAILTSNSTPIYPRTRVLKPTRAKSPCDNRRPQFSSSWPSFEYPIKKAFGCKGARTGNRVTIVVFRSAEVPEPNLTHRKLPPIRTWGVTSLAANVLWKYVPFSREEISHFSLSDCGTESALLFPPIRYLIGYCLICLGVMVMEMVDIVISYTWLF